MEGLTHWVCFLFFENISADVSERSTVLLCCQLPTDFHNINVVMCLTIHYVFCRFVSDDLWNELVCFQQPSLPIGKMWVPLKHFCAVSYTAKCIGVFGRRLGLCRLIAQPLIRSIVMELSISSVLWVLEVLFCVVCIDRVSIKSITACYGGLLLSSE